MTWLTNITARERDLREFWEREHGPFEPRGTYPGHKTPYCYDCASSFVYAQGGEGRGLTDIQRAATFFDAHDARYLVCEKHWRQRMRSHGYTNADIRRQLVESGGFTEQEADALLAADAETPSSAAVADVPQNEAGGGSRAPHERGGAL